MSLMPSLCAALERVGGERLVMRAGERPHVLAGDRRHDVASAILSVNAVEALAEQILSNDGRRELREKGAKHFRERRLGRRDGGRRRRFGAAVEDEQQQPDDPKHRQPGEEFLAAYRRLGAQPFKEALYAAH